MDFTPAAKRQLAELRENGFGNLPVCVAKTQYSFSDNAKALGAPENFRITVRELKVSAGAHFVVALTGSVLTMPGLPKVPAAENIDVDDNGDDHRPVLSRLSSLRSGPPSPGAWSSALARLRETPPGMGAPT